MRRRSNRSKPVEEPVEVLSPRKSKRQSRRRKQSTSESDDEPISTLIEKTAESSDVAGEDAENESEEQIWKVAPSPQSTTDGEIQKLKICLTKPSTSPEKSNKIHKKSSSHHEDEQSDEKTIRRSSRRSRSNVDDNRSEEEIQEDVDDKGKLKGKSKSKTDTLSDCDPCNDEKSQNIKSDDNISDNVQIDHQTVQSDNINTLTGKERADIEIQQEEHLQQESSLTSIDIQNSVTTIEVSDDIITVESEDIITVESEDIITVESDDIITVESDDVIIVEDTIQPEIDVKSIKTGDNSDESASLITPTIPTQIPHKEMLDNDEPQKDQKKDEVVFVKIQEVEPKEEELNKLEKVDVEKNGNYDGSEEEKQTVDTVDGKETNIVLCSKEDDQIDNSGTVISDKEEADDKSDSLNVTNDEIIMDDKEPTIPMFVTPQPRVCVYPKSMLAKNTDKTDIKPKLELPRLALIKLPKLTTERKRKWGQHANTREKLPDLNLVTSNLITEIYPNCKLLDENEVNLDISDVSSPSPAKVKRKISIEMPKDPQPDPKIDTKPTNVNGTGKEGIFDHVHDKERTDQASIIALNRKISIVEDTAAKLKPPPSPGKNPVAAVLYISNLVRPFTLKQLKELLERTGKIIDDGFWTDRIKSKCYAQYETAEDAEVTRNALHGVHWPIGNGKKLEIEFSTPEEMEIARNPPPIPPLIPANNNTGVPEPYEKENKEPARRSGGGTDDHREHHQHQRDHAKEEELQERRERRDSGGDESRRQVREWDVGKGEKRRSGSRSRDRRNTQHSRSRRSPSSRDYDRYKLHPKEEEPPPQKLMDDLFLKTKATPCIYWQALTPEEIALKQQQRLERMAEHQRRLQQNTNSGGLGSGGGYAPPAQQSRGGYGGSYSGPRRRY